MTDQRHVDPVWGPLAKLMSRAPAATLRLPKREEEPDPERPPRRARPRGPVRMNFRPGVKGGHDD